MAHEWYVQHGGKLYGPLTSTQLKKLAADSKIAATTQVRLGAEGNFVSASRVQGLFPANGAAAGGESKATTAPPPPVVAAKVAPPKAMPQAQVAPPPIAPPAAFGGSRTSFVPQAQTVASAPQSMPASLLGAVALVLGILALATCWLAKLGALGWLGIGVGSVGLILGIAGFIVSARRQGAGLALNIAGTSSSVVGLTLAVVFGVMFGLFGKAPPPAPPIVQVPIVAPPSAEPEPEPAAEPAPPPEPVWTLADQSIEQGPIRASIASAKIEQVRLENSDLSTLKKSKPQPMLKVVVAIENISTDRIVPVPGWPGGGDLIGQGVSELLGSTEVGKAVQSATASAKLTDNIGNPYKQVSLLSLFGAQLPGGDHSVRPAEKKQLELVYPPPLVSIEYLRIELSPAGFGGEAPLRFQIPRAMIVGMPDVKTEESVP